MTEENLYYFFLGEVSPEDWKARPEGEWGLLYAYPNLDRQYEYLENVVIEGTTIHENVAFWQEGISSCPYSVVYIPVGSREKAYEKAYEKVMEFREEKKRLDEIFDSVANMGEDE